MRSLRLSDTGQELVEVDVPRPSAAKGEVLVRVHAAGITPSELAWSPTSHTKNGEKRTGAVPSHEFSGEVAEVGEAVEGLSAGQEIYGMNDWFADGALADYCITRAEWIAPKPGTLNFAEAASVPIGALTAWQGLFDRANLRAGERVLVHGGTGGVGVFAVQLARLRGAYVITTVSAGNIEFAKELGADECIDYKASVFEERVRDVDVVFDAVGGETLERSWGVLNQHGRLVTVAAGSEATADERIKRAFFIVEPRHDQLVEVAKLLDARELKAVVDEVVPLSKAPDAYAGAIERTGRGKLVAAVR
jgi:NADPH:quinone reductase-like Zn-dependent oxidoreductase